MEGSKAFSKDFMARHAIPTAEYRNFTDHAAAVEYVKAVEHDVVLKASGLAAGKGVIIPSSKEEALAGLNDIMVSREFGSAGEEVVVEEFLTGQELSILTFSDGYTTLSLPPAQDHKRIGEGDTGPNTGGMGTYSPAPVATKSIVDEIQRTIVQPTIDGMRKDGASSWRAFTSSSSSRLTPSSRVQASPSSACSLRASCSLPRAPRSSSTMSASATRRRSRSLRSSRPTRTSPSSCSRASSAASTASSLR